MGGSAVLDGRRNALARFGIADHGRGHPLHQARADRPACDGDRHRQGKADGKRHRRARLRVHRRQWPGTARRHPRGVGGQAEDPPCAEGLADDPVAARGPILGVDQGVRWPVGVDHGRRSPVQRRRAEGGDRSGRAQSDHAHSDRPGKEDPRGCRERKNRPVALSHRVHRAQPSCRRGGGGHGPRRRGRNFDEGEPAHRRVAARGDEEGGRPAHRAAAQPLLPDRRAHVSRVRSSSPTPPSTSCRRSRRRPTSARTRSSSRTPSGSPCRRWRSSRRWRR